jgi:hypothetical protein
MHSKKDGKSKSVSNRSLIDSLHLPYIFITHLCPATRHSIQREIWCTGPYAGVDYNLTLCLLQHMYHAQPYNRVDLDPMPESTLSPSQGLRIWPQFLSLAFEIQCAKLLPKVPEYIFFYIHFFRGNNFQYQYFRITL